MAKMLKTRIPNGNTVKVGNDVATKVAHTWQVIPSNENHQRCQVCNREMKHSGAYYELNGKAIERGCLGKVIAYGGIESFHKAFKETTIKAMVESGFVFQAIEESEQQQ